MGAKNSPTSKKNVGKVPKSIHKAEREKMKREHLNKLFQKLADALEVGEQNSGKASILGETSRFVKAMLDQIKCLKKQKAALLSESQYVKLEKEEVEDETRGLRTEIGELKRLIKKQKKLDLNAPPAIEEESQDPKFTQFFVQDSRKLLNPVLMFPACPNFQDPDGVVTSNVIVTKPHPRYPTPSNSWPFQLLP